MPRRLAPKLKRPACPPVAMRTWIVRLYLGHELKATSAEPSEHLATQAAEEWRGKGPDHFAEVEVVTTERRLRS